MVLNGNIVEYEDIGPVVTDGQGIGGIDAEAVMLLINFVNYMWNYYVPPMRLNGGFSWRDVGNRFTQSVVDSIGPSGIDFVMRHVFTERYRQHFKEKDNRDIRRRIKRQQERSHRKAMKKAYNTRAMRHYIYTGIETDRRMERDKTRSPPPFIGADYLDEDPALTQEMNINNMVLRPADTAAGYNGAAMLDFKNRLTRKLHTEMTYEMSVILHSIQRGDTVWPQSTHATYPGMGPHLYCSYQTTLEDPNAGTFRFSGWNYPATIDAGTDTAVGDVQKRGVGWNHTIYVFAMDYPFLTMNPDTVTQDGVSGYGVGRNLTWKYRTQNSNTDRNLPTNLNTIMNNTDWTYLTHYYTVYNFDMTNTSHMPYIVEILVFRFIADVDAMDYKRQVLAPFRRQTFHLQEYINNATSNPVDIKILYRKRINLRGLDNYVLRNKNARTTSDMSEHCVPNANRENSATFKYICKNKYVIKRPILSNYDKSISDPTFFNTYYDRQKGIYCRMQAWTLEGDLIIDENVVPSVPYMNDVEQTANRNIVADESCTKLGFGVNVVINKKSYFKLDENMYKSYAAS